MAWYLSHNIKYFLHPRELLLCQFCKGALLVKLGG